MDTNEISLVKMWHLPVAHVWVLLLQGKLDSYKEKMVGGEELNKDQKVHLAVKFFSEIYKPYVIILVAV